MIAWIIQMDRIKRDVLRRPARHIQQALASHGRLFNLFGTVRSGSAPATGAPSDTALQLQRDILRSRSEVCASCRILQTRARDHCLTATDLRQLQYSRYSNMNSSAREPRLRILRAVAWTTDRKKQLNIRIDFACRCMLRWLQIRHC
jgi:hypothetical protein